MIQHVTPADLPALKGIIDRCGLFPSEMLYAMLSGYFESPVSEELWFRMELEGTIVAFFYAAPERMTEGTYNALLIAVEPRFQGKGIGSRCMTFLENFLSQKQVRILLVETSGLPEFAQTRSFYQKLNYKQVAVIPEFYQAGEDKVVFWKALEIS